MPGPKPACLTSLAAIVTLETGNRLGTGREHIMWNAGENKDLLI